MKLKTRSISSYKITQIVGTFAFVALTFFQVQNSNVQAATTPENCFEFSNGVITKYYLFEGDNSENNISCPNTVEIPSTISGEQVTAIGERAFSGIMRPEQHKLTSVVLPESLKSVGDYGFYFNNLSSIVIPDSVETIGSTAFASNGLTSISLGDSLITIGEYAFSSNLISSVVLPLSLTSIGSESFSFNTLTTISIPDQVTKLGVNSFRDNKLTSINIGSSVKEIDAWAFGNNLLTTVTIPNSVDSIGYNAFGGNKISSMFIEGTLESVDYDVLESNPIESITYNGQVHTMPEPTSIIREECLEYDAGTIIAYYATEDLLDAVVKGTSECGILKGNIIVPSNIGGQAVSAIGDSAFWAYEIDSVFLPSSVNEVDSSAFIGQNMDTNINYVLIYTSNPNINNSAIVYRGTNLGGHIFNPTSVKINYLNTNGDKLRNSSSVVGKLNGKYLSSYLVADGPEITETTDLSVLDDAYFNVGDRVNYNPPTIAGYSQPAARTISLNSTNNELDLVYKAETDQTPITNDQSTNNFNSNSSNATSTNGRLADTGDSQQNILMIALAIITLGVAAAVPLVKKLAR